MALFHCNFHSEVLRLAVSMDVILPQPTKTQIGMTGVASRKLHPTLYLLHGLSDDHTIWQRRTSIERYVAPLGLAVVMPDVHRSFYADMVHGYKYWTFMSEELPALCRAFFPLSSAREDNFVAGLSMGGYGAFKWALRCPGQFAAAASLSGALHRSFLGEDVAKMDPAWRSEMENIFGDLTAYAGSENDLVALASIAAKSKASLPALYQWCGTEDRLIEGNRRFRKHLDSCGIPVTYEEGPGIHEWGAWDKQIQRVLEWLPLPSRDIIQSVTARSPSKTLRRKKAR